MPAILSKHKSQIHGLGIFADRLVFKNTVFFEVKFTYANTYQKPKRGLARVGLRKYLDDPVINFVNHSCNPSSKLKISKTSAQLVSIRNIKKGDEITVNYSLTEKLEKRLNCNCQSQKCLGYFIIKV